MSETLVAPCSFAIILRARHGTATPLGSQEATSGPGLLHGFWAFAATGEAQSDTNVCIPFAKQ
jgi:hypothetical protein